MDSINYTNLRRIANEATQERWGPWTCNYPFYVDVKKPAPSLSKHDHDRPTYWKIEDAIFVLEFNPKVVVYLLNEIDQLKALVLELQNKEIK